MARYSLPIATSILALLSWPATAQLPDPTRPPAAAQAPAAPAAGSEGVASAEAGVQAVFVRSSGKSGAMINGQYVEVGGKVGDKRLVKVSESEIVLKGDGGRDVMKVTPAIQKTATAKPEATKRTGKERKEP